VLLLVRSVSEPIKETHALWHLLTTSPAPLMFVAVFVDLHRSSPSHGRCAFGGLSHHHGGTGSMSAVEFVLDFAAGY
jgi:hypothetical protein